jgi:threonine dehydrogenase-like Zn-dependent dehydrogenase
MMKVLRYPRPRNAEIVDAPTPRAIGRKSVAKTIATSVSAGTEMSFYRGETSLLNFHVNEYGLLQEGPGNIKFPMQSDGSGVWWMGYASVGRIIEVGDEATDVKVGNLVFTEGGHKEYQISDSFRLLPANVNPVNASLLSLIRIAFNGMLDARVKLMDKVVIFGMGIVGQLLLQMSKLSGAHVIAVDPLQSRLEMARMLGADETFDPSKPDDVGMYVQQRTNGHGADIIFEASGNVDALSDAIRCCGADGVVTVMSFYRKPPSKLHLDHEFHHRRITLRSSQVGGVCPLFSRHYNWNTLLDSAIGLLPKLNLDPLVSHRIKFDALPITLEMIDRDPQQSMVVVVEYW